MDHIVSLVEWTVCSIRQPSCSLLDGLVGSQILSRGVVSFNFWPSESRDPLTRRLGFALLDLGHKSCFISAVSKKLGGFKSLVVVAANRKIYSK